LAPHSSASLSYLERKIAGEFGRVQVGAIYSSLGQRMCQHLDWYPNNFRNGYPNWIGVLAEYWKPEGRDHEWVLLPAIRTFFLAQSGFVLD